MIDDRGWSWIGDDDGWHWSMHPHTQRFLAPWWSLEHGCQTGIHVCYWLITVQGASSDASRWSWDPQLEKLLVQLEIGGSVVTRGCHGGVWATKNTANMANISISTWNSIHFSVTFSHPPKKIPSETVIVELGEQRNSWRVRRRLLMLYDWFFWRLMMAHDGQERVMVYSGQWFSVFDDGYKGKL